MRIKKKAKNGVSVDNQSTFLDGNGNLCSPDDFQLDPTLQIGKDFDVVLSLRNEGGFLRMLYYPDGYNEQVENDICRYTLKAGENFYELNSYDWLFENVGSVFYYVVYAALCEDLSKPLPFKVIRYSELKDWINIENPNGVHYLPIYMARIELDPTTKKPIVQNCKSWQFFKKNVVNWGEQFNRLKHEILDSIPVIDKVFSNIPERDRYIEIDTLQNGQVVKVTDASNDPEINSGWAIYKYYTTNNQFNLLAKEERI